MLKKKPKPQSAAAEVAPDVAVDGNVFQKLWSMALVVAIAPLLLVLAYLLVVRETLVVDEQITLLSSSQAEQQAARIEQLFARLDTRLQTAAATPLARSALTAASQEQVSEIEQSMLDYFPGAVSLRIIILGAKGTAGLADDNQGLRNHIEVDLLRRTAKGESTAPESFKFDGRWLTTIARKIANDEDTPASGVLLASIDNQLLSDALAAAGTDSGRSALLQLYRKGNYERSDEIAQAGAGSESDYTMSHPLNDDRWQLSFTPSQTLVAALTPSLIVPLAGAGIAVLAVLGGLLMLRQQYPKALEKEVEMVMTSANKKTAILLTVPELLPLSKLLRRAVQRPAARAPAAASAPAPDAEATKPATPEGEMAAPMFQTVSMIDDDLDSLDLDDESDLDLDLELDAEPDNLMAQDDGLPGHIFRAYDIRGVADTELDDELIEKIGAALGTIAGEHNQQTVIVGCDGRLSSPRIKTTLTKALAASGRDVIDLGAVPTPVLYYATHALESRTGIMITGSHNPVADNGLKIVMDGKPFAGDKIKKLRQRIAAGNFSKGDGRIVDKDIVTDYIDTIAGDMAIAVSLKIVVDAGNGIAGGVAPRLLEELGCEVVPLYCEVDGTFPNHHPDTSDESNLADLQQRVVAEGADLGVAFDGDGDRLAVVSPEGEIIRTDKLLMLYAQDIVSRNPGADVIFDVKCSRHLTQLVSRYGGRPIIWKTGHAFMKEKMRETGALLGGEFSGHVFFGERWFGFDDGMYSACRLAEILSGSDSGLAPLLADFPVTENTPEIKMPASDNDKFGIVQSLVDKGDFSPGKVNDLDGVRVDYSDGWGLLRASNTGPALTARFEGDTEEALNRIMQQFRDQLKAVANIDASF